MLSVARINGIWKRGIREIRVVQPEDLEMLVSPEMPFGNILAEQAQTHAFQQNFSVKEVIEHCQQGLLDDREAQP